MNIFRENKILHEVRKKVVNNKLFSLMLFIESIIIVISIRGLLQEPVSYTITGKDFYATNENTENIIQYEEESIEIFNENGKDEEYTLHSFPISIKSGAYEVTIEYTSTSDINNVVKDEHKDTGSLRFYSDKNIKGVKASTLRLHDGQTELTMRLWVRLFGNVDDLTAYVDYNGNGRLVISNITLLEKPLWKLTRTIGYIFLFAVINFSYLFFANNNILNIEEKRKKIIIQLGFIISFSSVLFLADYLFHGGQDLPFHMSRIYSLANSLENGQFPQRIQQNMLNGYGYATPLFYGELFLYIPAFLYCLYVPLQTCYQIYVIGINICTCLISYWCFKKITESDKLGMLGSCLYTLSAYRLTNLMIREAVGEYTAQTFLPLLFYGFWHIYKKDDSEKITLPDYLPIVVGLSGIIQSHVLTCQMSALFIGLFVLRFYKKTFRVRRFLALCKSVILTVLLNIWFLLPFLSSMGMDVNVANNNIVNKIEARGAEIVQLFGVFHTYSGRAISNSMLGEMPLSVGIALVIGFFLFLWCCIKRKVWNLNDKRLFKNMEYVSALTLLALFMASSYFPWDNLEILGEKIARVMCVIQFPWRYLTIATLFLVYITVCSMQIIEEKVKSYSNKIIMIIVFLSILTEGYTMMGFANTADTVTWYDGTQLNSFSVGNNEYLLRQTDREQLTVREILCGENVTAQETDSETNGDYTIWCKNSSGQVNFVDVPVLAYNNYHAYDLMSNCELSVEKGTNSRVRVLLPEEYEGTVCIKYVEPTVWRVTECISLITFIGLGVGILYYRIRLKDRKIYEKRESLNVK